MSALFNGQTSRPYSSIGIHLNLIKWRTTSTVAVLVYLCVCTESCLAAGDETAGEMTSEVEQDQRWLGRHCDAMVVMSPRCDVNVDDRQPETEVKTASGCVVNGRSPTPSAGECLRPQRATTPGTTAATFVPEMTDNRSPQEMTSRRGSWESDAMSDTWSSLASVAGPDDNRTETTDVKPEPEVADAPAIIVVSDSSPTPPPPNLVASSEHQKGTVLSPRSVELENITIFSKISRYFRKYQNIVTVTVYHCIRWCTSN